MERQRLSPIARAVLEDSGNEFYFSAVSFWEIAIKRALNRPDFQIDPQRLRDGLLAQGYIELPLKTEHTLALSNLPQIHKDPFDRVIVAQAISEDITLLTADARLAGYPGPIRKV